MDLIRAALEEFVEESVNKIAPKTGVPFAPGPKASHFRAPLDYLRDHHAITVDEHYAVNGIYKMLSNAGVHKLESSLELARVARNLVIEWLLLLSGRVEGFSRP